MCIRIIFVLFVMASISDDVQFCVSGQQFPNIQEEAMQNEANKHDNLHGTLEVMMKKIIELSDHLLNLHMTMAANQMTIIRTMNNFDSRLDVLENMLHNNLFTKLENISATVAQSSTKEVGATGELLIANISQLVTIGVKKTILPKVNVQVALLKNLTSEERNIIRLLENITLSRKNSSQEGCQPDADANINTTTTHPDADPSASRLLNVTVPSSVRARTDAWKDRQIPEEDDLDKFMKNATGCEYMARGRSGDWQSVSNSTARAGTWRRQHALRGESSAIIRVTWGAGHGYNFVVGDSSNKETIVYDLTQHTHVLRRVTPGVMSQHKYTQFYYIQLEDGVMSFGVLGDSTPWWRHDVAVSAGDVIQMKYRTFSRYGLKLLVCA